MISEQIWNSCFGPASTPESVLAEAADQGITIQDFARMSAEIAAEQGFTAASVQAAFESLCKQLGVCAG